MDMPLPHLDRPFDYAVPDGADCPPGCRVRVRFAGRLVDGYVLSRSSSSAHRLAPLKVVSPEVATDYRNADPKLRGRKVIGIPLIWGFKRTSDPNAFEGGQIYNGEDGKMYSANISIEPDGRLKLRGYSGSPMFGATQYWTRVQ